MISTESTDRRSIVDNDYEYLDSDLLKRQGDDIVLSPHSCNQRIPSKYLAPTVPYKRYMPWMVSRMSQCIAFFYCGL